MAIIIGLVFLAFSVWAILPFSFPLGLNWGAEVLAFLRGAAPVLIAFIGLVAVFIGLADAKDKAAAKKAKSGDKPADKTGK